MADTETSLFAALRRSLEEFTLAKAATLARKGRLDDADRLLSDRAIAPDASSSVLDLLARVYAQQGRFTEAADLWRRALQIDPNSSTMTAALARATASAQRKVPRRTGSSASAALLLLAALTALFAVLIFRLVEPANDNSEQLSTINSQIDGLRADVASVHDSFASLESSLDGRDRLVNNLVDDLERDIDALRQLHEDRQPAATDDAASPTDAPTCSYTIKLGDTLASIAASHDTDVSTLARTNGIPDANRIFAGRMLTIPNCVGR